MLEEPNYSIKKGRTPEVIVPFVVRGDGVDRKIYKEYCTIISTLETSNLNTYIKESLNLMNKYKKIFVARYINNFITLDQCNASLIMIKRMYTDSASIQPIMGGDNLSI